MPTARTASCAGTTSQSAPNALSGRTPPGPNHRPLPTPCRAPDPFHAAIAGPAAVRPSDAEAFARAAARHMRAAAARYRDDPEVTTPVDDLLAGSAEFARLRAASRRTHRPTRKKPSTNGQLAPYPPTATSLRSPTETKQVMIYTAGPISPAEEALRLIRVIGLRRVEAGALTRPPSRPSALRPRAARGRGSGLGRGRARSMAAVVGYALPVGSGNIARLAG
ncbi:hypothetical protein [Embleya sp. NBC_00888]|uniref:MmyB family transcriptional regulator n=1 Tax=Embleya sp. NBC_00888 TaxID=2975960 RepID=UPI00386DEDC6